MIRRNTLENLSVIFVLLLSVTIVPSVSESTPTYHIRDHQSLFSLDATDTLNITIQIYDSSNLYQKWRVQPATTVGTFNIINEGWGKALNHSIDESYHKATLEEFSPEDKYQQWYINYDGTIVSAGDGVPNFGLAVFRSAYMEGDWVDLWERRYLGVKDMFVFQEDSTS